MSGPDPLAAIAERALDFVNDGTIVGLGTGRAAMAFVRALGARVRAGLRVQGVPTSLATAALAEEVGIPLLTLEQAKEIDVVIDGADEVDPHLDLIKGYGGAMVREKIVAASARRLVIVVGDEKLVPQLGARGTLPVEVLPFGLALGRSELRKLGLAPRLRLREGDAYLTDNGNHILDCATAPIEAPRKLEESILAIPGVVGSGLFIGMATAVVVGGGGGVRVMQRGAGY